MVVAVAEVLCRRVSGWGMLCWVLDQHTGISSLCLNHSGRSI